MAQFVKDSFPIALSQKIALYPTGFLDEIILDAVRTVDKELKMSKVESDHSGATLCGILFHKGQAYVFSVGDSICYSIGSLPAIKQISEIHDCQQDRE